MRYGGGILRRHKLSWRRSPSFRTPAYHTRNERGSFGGASGGIAKRRGIGVHRGRVAEKKMASERLRTKQKRRGLKSLEGGGLKASRGECLTPTLDAILKGSVYSNPPPVERQKRGVVGDKRQSPLHELDWQKSEWSVVVKLRTKAP